MRILFFHMTQVEQDFKEERRRRKELSISLCDSSEDSGVIFFVSTCTALVTDPLHVALEDYSSL